MKYSSPVCTLYMLESEDVHFSIEFELIHRDLIHIHVIRLYFLLKGKREWNKNKFDANNQHWFMYSAAFNNDSRV